MNESQKKKCHAIIHSHAVAAAAGNAVPLPGLGVAVDMVAMTTMTMSLCAVFGGSIAENAAKTLAITALKNTMLRQPIRVLTKELSKLVPFLGQVVAPSITVLMLESAGWVLAADLERQLAKPSSSPTVGEKSIERKKSALKSSVVKKSTAVRKISNPSARGRAEKARVVKEKS